MIKRLLIIPARSGSKRIKNKNIKNFLGRPIIEYPLSEAIKSNLFNKIHVSTDNYKILDKLKKFKLKEDFLRPKSLSLDSSTLSDVIKYVVNKLNQNYDEIWCILPCSPLIKKDDLIKIANMFKKARADHLMTVSSYPCPIEWAYTKKKGYLIELNKKKINIPSQNFKEKFYDTGNVYVYKKNFFSKKKINKIGFNLPNDKGIDIDTINDWKFAEKIYLLNKNK
tara:strand:- start:676 stop:1347 length:672 start_codon:yes stop_codon:yes gene_type:complete